MNTIQRGITTLLRSAITGEKLPLPEDFQLGDALKEVNRHSIATLVYEGAVNCGIDRSTPEMQQLFQVYLKMLMISEGQMREVKRLFAAFEVAGIDYMPLKGCKMKALYPKPELRTMGDADILIRMEQYEKIKPIMLSLGFEEDAVSEYDITWTNKHLHVELHYNLFNSYNEVFWAYFGNGWKNAVLENGTRYTMNPEHEFIYELSHFIKHFQYRGIGCRHVVDLWMYLRCHPDMEMDIVQKELEKLRLLDFYGNIQKMLAVWFEDDTADEMTELLTQYIFSSGTWGNKETALFSSVVRSSRNSAVKRSGRAHYFWTHLFPSAKALEQGYPILKKQPYVLPAVWGIRLVRKTFDRKAIARTEANLKALDQSKVDERQRMLNYVGLDYNF